MPIFNASGRHHSVESVATAGTGCATASPQHPAPKNNFDVFSNREEVSQMLLVAEQRMRKLGYEDQRINDILGLAKLKILGDRLNLSQSKTKSKSSSVLKAVQQFRKDLAVVEGDHDRAEGDHDGAEVASDDGYGAETPRSEEGSHSPLGFMMPAIATPRGKKDDGQQHEDVIICCGIIDILQAYNLRKVVEHSFMSVNYSPSSLT
eukprot:gene633-2069_t